MAIAVTTAPSTIEIASDGPWRTAWKRLRRKRSAMAALATLFVIVGLSLAAPLYARYVAHTQPFQPNISGTTIVNGKTVDVIQQSPGLGLGETPIGPTWNVHHYFLGADNEGRDVASLVLYGGRASLIIALSSALGACCIATILALIAGFFGGLLDSVLARLMDLVWAFPVYLLAILIATVSLTQPLRLGPIAVSSDSLDLPIIIIGFIFVPYVFRPIRGAVLAIRERDFVQAAMLQGASNRWLITSEILPNVVSTVTVLLPLMVALTMLTESALSFLGLGVQPPNVSWGSLIGEGQALLYTRPAVAIAPGVFISVVVIALNVLGDGVRDALNVRARVGVGGS